MTVAFCGLFVVLALVVVDIALALGLFGATARLIQIMPLVLSAALFETAETFAFGGALSILIAIFAAWLGGLLAPTRIPAVVAIPATAGPVVPRESRRHPLPPGLGPKGGEPPDQPKGTPPSR